MTLEYLNEDDRAYGLAGMAVSLAALDAVDNVVGVSLDADGPMVTFSNGFYFLQTPTYSARASWNHLLNTLYITSAMVMSNVMARSIVRMHEDVPQELIDRIHEEVAAEAREACALDDDEIDALFDKTRVYMGRIFRNPRLHPAIDQFARTLSRKRTLSGNELIDELRALSIL